MSPRRRSVLWQGGLKERVRTNSGRLDHVADGEALDGLILGRAARAVAASDGLGVAAALLVAAAGSMLVYHRNGAVVVCSGARDGIVGDSGRSIRVGGDRTCSFSS